MTYSGTADNIPRLCAVVVFITGMLEGEIVGAVYPSDSFLAVRFEGRPTPR
jgi:hypothetical protein